MRKKWVFKKLVATGMACLLGLATAMGGNVTNVEAATDLSSLLDLGLTFLTDNVTATSAGYTVDESSNVMILPGTVLDLSAIAAADFESKVVIDGAIDNEGLVIYDKGVDAELVSTVISGTGVFGYKDASNNMQYWRVDEETSDIVPVNFLNGDLVLSTTPGTGAGYTWSSDGAGGMIFHADSLYVNGNIVFPYNTKVTIESASSAAIAGNVSFAAGPSSEVSKLDITVTGNPFYVGGNITGQTADDTLTLKNMGTLVAGAVTLGTGTEGGTVSSLESSVAIVAGKNSPYAIHTAAFHVAGGMFVTLNTIELNGTGSSIQVDKESIVETLLCVGTGAKAIVSNNANAFTDIKDDLLAVYEVKEYETGFYTIMDLTSGEPAKLLILMASQPPMVIPDETDYSVEIGGAVTLAVSALSLTGGTISYQWQVYVDGEWVNIDDATAAEYKLEDVSADMNGLVFRCVVTGTGGVTNSEEITLAVVSASDTPTGDQVNMGPWYALAGAAFVVIIAAAGYTIVRHKKNNSAK